MTQVLIDGRIDGHDGIGRYTRCLTQALRFQAGPGVRIKVLPPTGTPRYSRGEGAELLQAARTCGAELIHVLDYRVPLESASIPLVVTIHDVLRLVRPQFCYSDEEFAAGFGTTGLAELAAMTVRLGRAAVAVGSVSDATLLALYAHAEALVHLAAHEGFGFTPLEALAAGTRVVASDIPVLRETLAEHALFADAAGPDAIARAISDVIATRDERAARQRRRRWARRYTRPNWPPRVVRPYRKCRDDLSRQQISGASVVSQQHHTASCAHSRPAH